MKTYVLLLVCVLVMANENDDPAGIQIVSFKNNTLGPVGIMTTFQGTPINYEDASGTLNKRLIFHEFFMDSITHLSRERIPPRLVHAKGGGGFGYFVVTHDIKDICKARVFEEIGKKTPIAVRFSPTMQEKGGIDTSRDTRGFAVKFYTEDGNFDIVALNVPMFVMKDPLFFSSFVHSRMKNPQTSFSDPNMSWDFLLQHPEATHTQIHLFSDLGIPDGYRHMPGFGIHTFQVVNEVREKYFIRFHFTPDAGVKNLGSLEALKLAALDPDYANRDLYNSIETGNFPSWLFSIQVLSISDVKNAGFDVFDVSKILPEDRYPLRPVGRLVLSKNPVNFFAEMEQLAFCPGNLVPGILGAPDKVFEARRLSYRDAQYYRLGANFASIDVNRPIGETFTYSRDGRPPVRHNQRNLPNYYPNSYNGPVPYLEKNTVDLIEIFEGPADNFEQTRELYNKMTLDERTRLIENVLNSLGSVIDSSLKDQSVELLKKIHPDLSRRVWEGLYLNKSNYYWNRK